MPKDLFLLDTNCHLNRTISKFFSRAGYEVETATDIDDGVTDEVLRRAAGFTAICIFVNKKIADDQMHILKENGNKLILCCSAGYDNVPVDLCREAGIRIGRVPSYSPSSIAEYAISSMLALAKNLQKSYELTKKADFKIGGLHCMLLEDKTVGIIGTGLIGKKTVQKASGLFKEVLCYDVYQDNDWIASIPNAKYVDLDTLLEESNIISIHIPLFPETKYLINKESIKKMKKHAIIINTSRGEIINTSDLVQGLKNGEIFGAALDVFEGEKAFIFKDMTKEGFTFFPELSELTKMTNVIISSHLAFYTDESLRQITLKTLQNYKEFQSGIVDEKAFVA